MCFPHARRAIGMQIGFFGFIAVEHNMAFAFSRSSRLSEECERRRASTLVRSKAVLTPNAPVKQSHRLTVAKVAKKNSSPLPQERRQIYEKDHLHSKSWNPEVTFDDDPHEYPMPLPPMPQRFSVDIQPQQHPVTSRYGATNQTLPYTLFPPTQRRPSNTGAWNQLGVRQPFERQARSFDDRPNERSTGWTERRSQSEREDRAILQRQITQHEEALIAETAIGQQCQTLWEARSHLEQLRRIGIEDPSSASTSFESNTEAILISPRNTPKGLMTGSSVEDRRNKYRSVLLQRKTLPGGAFDSIESTFSNESNGIDEQIRAAMAQMTSVDSSGAELTPRARPMLNQRDYSVDAASDSMFREFSRIDPKYEPAQFSLSPRRPSQLLQKWETFDHCSPRHHPGPPPRQLSHTDHRFV
ncbi:unnamed protein product, partial [Mesorhabditis spiculigera]